MPEWIVLSLRVYFHGHDGETTGETIGVTMHRHFEEQLIASLRCKIEDGDLLMMPPDLDTGWRQLPWTIVAQALDGDMVLECAGRDSICVHANKPSLFPLTYPIVFRTVLAA
jgi:hypothetical protein